MAVLKYCPSCKQSQEVTKKGFNADGEQLYICKVCNKKFVPITGTGKKAKVEKTPTKTTAKIAPKAKGTTEIIVNNNTIKTVTGLLSIDQAFDMVSSYFKEIAKEKATIAEHGDKKVITFKVTAGGKG